ncbi:MAG TPA: cation:proton antiporter [archaeon]|nr:cation:proton antiporter [archaeon]
MAIDPFSILILFSLTIVVGYVGSYIFSKTRIPDVILLLFFGMIVGPLFHLVDTAIFLTISPFLAALAILIILFDAGLNMDFYQMVHSFSRSMFLAVLEILLGIVVVAFVSMQLFGFDLLRGMLLGTILGGTSSAIVIVVVSRLKMNEKAKTFLNLESIITDPMVVVIAIVLIGMITQSAVQSPVNSILATFSIGAVLGILAGVIWLIVLDRLHGRPFDYMLTLAVLFLLYTFVESTGGSGAIAALLFGLVLGNGLTFSKILKSKKREGFGHLLRTFQSEVSFFIRSFFFVYLGLIVSINPTYLIYGIGISVLLIITRIAAVQLSTIKMGLTKLEKNISMHMAPRGLATAVLAQLPISYGIAGAQIFSDIAFVVILATMIYTTIAVKICSKEKKPKKPDSSEEEVHKEEKHEKKGKKK